MSEHPRYPTAAILTILTDILLTDFETVGRTAGAILGRPLWTHEIPAAFAELEPWIKANCPQLANIDTTGLTADRWSYWLSEQVARLGESVIVPTVTYSALAEKDPITTAVEAFGPEKVIGIEVSDLNDPMGRVPEDKHK